MGMALYVSGGKVVERMPQDAVSGTRPVRPPVSTSGYITRGHQHRADVCGHS